MDPQNPQGKLYTLYAFTGAGRNDEVAATYSNGSSSSNNNNGSQARDGDGPMSPEEFNRRLRRIAPARGDRFDGDLHDTCMVIERSKNLNLVLYTTNLVDPETQQPVETGKGRQAVVNAKDPLRAYWIKLEPEHVARRRARGQMEDICELNYVEKKLAYGCHATRTSSDKLTAELRALLKKTATPLQPEQEAIVAEWDAYFHPCVAKYVAAPQWPVFLLTLPPLPEARSKEVAAAAEVASPSPMSPTTPEHPRQNEAPSAVKKDVGGDVSTAPGFSPADTVPVMLAVIDGQLSLLKKVYVTSVEPKHFYQLPSVESLEAFGVSVATGKDTYEKRMNK